MKIGVLALQGAVAEHIRMIERAGAEAIAVKKAEQLDDLDGMIVPGGESTTIGRLMNRYGFTESLREFSAQRKPVFGTCAGLILLANDIVGQSERYLSLIDMKVKRNAFGRQRESFEAELDVKGIDRPLRAVFIRAPIIESVGEHTEVLATYQDRIVAVRQGHLLGTSFHPELTDDHRMHQYFLNMVNESALAQSG